MISSPYRPVTFRALSLLFLCAAAEAAHAGTLPERCGLKPVNGNCKAIMERYYFDAKSGRCTEYFYDGCGPVVPFETLEECRALCETAPTGDNAAGPARNALGEPETLARESAVAAKPPEKIPVASGRSALARDPVENDPRYAEIFRTIDDEVKAELAGGDVQQRGSVYLYWSTKKGLLKRKYGIDWRDPAEMNPHVIFD